MLEAAKLIFVDAENIPEVTSPSRWPFRSNTTSRIPLLSTICQFSSTLASPFVLHSSLRDLCSCYTLLLILFSRRIRTQIWKSCYRAISVQVMLLGSGFLPLTTKAIVEQIWKKATSQLRRRVRNKKSKYDISSHSQDIFSSTSNT